MYLVPSIWYSMYLVLVHTVLDTWYLAPVQVEKVKIWNKIMKIGPNQVHNMAPFRLILNQDRSHRVWDNFGMPPGLQNALETTISWIFIFFSVSDCVLIILPITTLGNRVCCGVDASQITLVCVGLRWQCT